MQVELKLFSGRHNPRLKLEGAVICEIQKRTVNLPGAPPQLSCGMMGYRGFGVQVYDNIARVIDSYSICNGVISFTGPNRYGSFWDLHGIERFFANQAYLAGYHNLYNYRFSKT